MMGAASGPLNPVAEPCVRHFRQSLLWPLELVSADGPDTGLASWQRLLGQPDGAAWQSVTDDDGAFEERHYNEFVAFLPYVQRFLYGEGRAGAGAAGQGGESPMRVFRRHDIHAVRVTTLAGAPPLVLRVEHVDLYFFYDVELVLLNVEVCADALPLSLAQEVLYRFGRAYPGGWNAQGDALHCMHAVEWLGQGGEVLACSDAQDRTRFMAHVSEHRTPRIAHHWAHILHPLVSDHSGANATLRYRQIEYYRMPVMAYLSLDQPLALARSDFIRLGLVVGGAEVACSSLPYAEQHLSDFEQRYCYDRFWGPGGPAPYTRYLCSGHSLVVVGPADSTFYGCGQRGVLAQFRHQHFKLFLIAHFQKAALLMYSDQLVDALRGLNVGHAASVRRFKRAIRRSFESFLRFTHRYWFHEISEQAQVRALFQMCAHHLGLDPLYAEVKERIADMSSYLDADSLRRQANTVVRLTVVTIFGLIGTITTGFLGMNLLAEAESPWTRRLAIFATVFVLTTALTVYTMVKSKRLSDFLDAVSDERVGAWDKLRSFAAVWSRRPD